ncbi:hypothetical protein INR76_03260 [Marixanthomonas sp. SCSIO 43207]|uniref:MbnP family protein n=1 Tax=Marixanthomonas sp. SCSIO 43207 TaxID=2779360 RepID=UPI001CA8390D|nr:MbnP family protein [Marixanthomonas sp. SCSIO 43207]UAB81790.1 hypothetical protein INR76_03260 [Marixanthomonas sp. SCSIO 43207]
MKKVALLLAVAFTVLACKDVDENEVVKTDYDVQFNFTQNWDGQEINNADYQTTEYTNDKGDVLTISKLNYLISNVTFTSEGGQNIVIDGYNVMNAREGVNVQYNLDQKIPEGDYTVSFTFGFNDEDNVDGIYPELNTQPWDWGVPMMLGGGYHFMRLEGMYTDNTDTQSPYLYHAIRAATNIGDNPVTEDTSFEVNLGTISINNDTSIEVKMNVAEWFKNPNQWDLNVWNINLMMNAEAQRAMSANGKSVFSLGTVEEQ